MRLTALACLAVAACTENVTVLAEVPAPYRGEVESLVLHVLEPPASEPFTCDDVALGDVPQTTLELSETWRTSLDGPGEEPLRLGRRADKRLWVEGVDVTGLPIVEGCAELGNVTSDVEVVVDLEPSVTLDVLLDSGAGWQAWVRDVFGSNQTGVDVTWRRVEAGGDVIPGVVTTDGRGRAPLNDIPRPQVAGPTLIELLVRWSREGKTVFPGFATPPLLGPTEIGEVVSMAAGRIGQNGGHAAVGIALGCGGNAEEWGTTVVAISQGGNLVVDPVGSCAAGPPEVITVLAMAGGRDRVVSMSQDSWRSIERQQDGFVVVGGSLSPAMSAPPRRLFAVGRCDQIDSEILATAEDGTVLGIYKIPTGDGVAEIEAGPFTHGVEQAWHVESAGCVSDGAGGERRVVFTRDGAVSRMIVADPPDGSSFCRQPWDTDPPLTPPTVAMTDVVERHMVYAVNVNDLEAVAARLDLSGGGCRPLVTVRESLPALPVALESGDIDGDGSLDLTAVIGSVRIVDEKLRFIERVWASLGVEHGGERLAGISEDLENLLVTRLSLFDADGDGYDDVIMIAKQTGQADGSIAVARSVALGVRMGEPPQ